MICPACLSVELRILAWAIIVATFGVTTNTQSSQTSASSSLALASRIASVIVVVSILPVITWAWPAVVAKLVSRTCKIPFSTTLSIPTRSELLLASLML